MVQKLTEENERMVHKLNEASIMAEQLQGREKQHESERRVLSSKWREMEKEVGRVEKENRELKSKVKVLGGELVGLEERLLRETNERLRLVGGQNSRGDIERIQADARREIQEAVKEKSALQKRVEELEAVQNAMRVELEDERSKSRSLRDGYPVPYSAVLSSNPMSSYQREHDDQRNQGDREHTAHISEDCGLKTEVLPEVLPEVLHALLPLPTWIPSKDRQEAMQKDIAAIISRIYEKIEQKRGEDRAKNEAGAERASDHEMNNESVPTDDLLESSNPTSSPPSTTSHALARTYVSRK
jgi:hypothetical protein